MTTNRHGFTLLELSIVLVIIGLIVGGILVGQDLIKASEIRATVAQIEKYNSAVNTFRSKYNGIPGDLTSDKASSYGFTSRAGTAGRGDGNGIIDGTGATNNNQCFTQEAAMFWNDLSTASLIDGNLQGTQNQDPGANPGAVTQTQVPTTFPGAKLARGNYITVGSVGGSNYWLISGITGVTVTTGAYSLTENLTPLEASNIDTKMDDGQPNTGAVQQHGTSASTTTAFGDAGNWVGTGGGAACIMGTAGGNNATDPTDTYNVSIANGGNSPNCILRLRFN